MRITYTLCLTLLIAMLTGCTSKGQELSLTTLLDQKPEAIFQAKNIRFKVSDVDSSTQNYIIKLYGEKLPAQAVKVLVPEYNINWDKDAIEPVLALHEVPLQSPSLLLDGNGKILLVVAGIGNDGPKGKAKAGVFTDDDVIKLKKALTAQLGKEKMVRKDSFEGDVYVWKKAPLTVRFSIENENFENKSESKRNGVAQDGRHGVVTIYNGVAPEFYDKSNNYFNDPEIRK